MRARSPCAHARRALRTHALCTMRIHGLTLQPPMLHPAHAQTQCNEVFLLASEQQQVLCVEAPRSLLAVLGDEASTSITHGHRQWPPSPSFPSLPLLSHPHSSPG